MKCNKCGTENPDGMLFCGECGAKLEAEGTETVEETMENLFFTEEETVEEPVSSKKKITKKRIITWAVIAVTLIFGFVFRNEILGRLAFLLPAKTQMQLAYKSSAKDLAEDIGKVVTKIDKTSYSDDGCLKGSVSVSLGDEAKELLETYADVDLGDITQANIDYELRIQENMMLISAKAGIGNLDIISLEIVEDMEEGKISVSCPEISDTAIEAEFDFDFESFEEGMATLEMLEGLLDEILPSEKLLKDMIPRYAGVIIKAMDDVERESKKVKVGGVTQKLRSLTVELDSDMVRDIGKAIADELEDDKEFKKYLKKVVTAVCEFSGEEISSREINEAYDMMVEGVEYAFDELSESYVFEQGIDIVTWVNGKNEIVGFEIEDLIEIVGVKDGKKVAKHILLLEDGEEYMEFLAKGEEKKDVFSGKVMIYQYEEEIFAFKVNKYVNTDDTFELAVEVPITDEMLKLGSLPMNSFGDASIKYEMKLTSSSTRLGLKLMVGGAQFFEIETTNSMKNDSQKITYPKKVVNVDEEGYEEWIKTANFTKIIKNLKKSGLLDVLDIDADYLEKLLGNKSDYFSF